MPRAAFRNIGNDGAGGVFGGEVGYEPRNGGGRGVEGPAAEAGEFGDECFSSCQGYES